MTLKFDPTTIYGDDYYDDDVPTKNNKTTILKPKGAKWNSISIKGL
jgi:hypothetical protein